MKRAVVAIGFGGPERPEEVRDFVQKVLSGRPVGPERIDEVVSHYMSLGGRSPINELTREQVAGLTVRLASEDVPVLLGHRFAEPSLDVVCAELVQRGVTHVVALPMTAYGGAASAGRYKAAFEASRAKFPSLAGLKVEWTSSISEETIFVDCWVEIIRAALASGALDPSTAALVFTGHSIPVAADVGRVYSGAIACAIAGVVDRGAFGFARTAQAWQSRSGTASEAWLEPDVCDKLRELHEAGLRGAMVCPIGFIVDHVEVLFDLDIQARAVAEELQMGFVRVSSPNAHPLFLDAMALVTKRALEAVSRD